MGRGRQPVRQQPNGVANVAQMPDPNSGMALHEMAARTPNTDPLGHAVEARAQAHREQREKQEFDNRLDRNVGYVTSSYSDPRWDAFKQSLFEAGVDEVQTGAAAGVKQGGGRDVLHTGEGDELTTRQIGGVRRDGFFDTQSPSMAGLRNAAQMNADNNWRAFATNTMSRLYR